MTTTAPAIHHRRARRARLTAAFATLALCVLSAGPSTTGALATSTAKAAVPKAAVPPVTISPLPGTPDANPHTQISFLGVPASEIADVSVVGSASGKHSGKLESYDSAPGASFLPNSEFIEGEHVQVSAMVGPSGDQKRVSSAFTIAKLFHLYVFPTPKDQAVKPGAGIDSFVSAPSLAAPAVDVTTDSPNATPGDVFFTSNEGDAAWGPTIVNEKGQLAWFHQVPAGDHATDFKVSEYEGKPVLLWWQGHIPPIGVGFGEDEIYNTSYQHVATIKAGNGLHADLHEVQLTPKGSAFITAYTLVQANETAVGGYSEAGLLDAVLQEVDVKTGLVMFEWHAYGHVPLSYSYSKPSVSRGWPFDYFHLNSVSFDPAGDGNFLISSRNTSAGYEINHVTGKIMWELGGKHSSFKMGPGTQTAYQHDIEWQKNGTITVFDDGASPKVHMESRALHEEIDYTTKTVKVVSIFDHDPPLLAESQGNYQELADGDAFVGWGQEPYFTEFGPKGEVLFEGHLPLGTKGTSYRAYRFAWTGTPTEPPAIAVRGTAAGGKEASLEVYASWNGATDVSSWRLLGGTSATKLTAIATAAQTDFQVQIPVKTKDAWLAVQALGASGEVLATSKTVKS